MMMAADKKNIPEEVQLWVRAVSVGRKMPSFRGMCTSKPSVGVRTCARKGMYTSV